MYGYVAGLAAPPQCHQMRCNAGLSCPGCYQATATKCWAGQCYLQLSNVSRHRNTEISPQPLSDNTALDTTTNLSHTLQPPSFILISFLAMAVQRSKRQQEQIHLTLCLNLRHEKNHYHFTLSYLYWIVLSLNCIIGRLGLHQINNKHPGFRMYRKLAAKKGTNLGILSFYSCSL